MKEIPQATEVIPRYRFAGFYNEVWPKFAQFDRYLYSCALESSNCVGEQVVDRACRESWVYSSGGGGGCAKKMLCLSWPRRIHFSGFFLVGEAVHFGLVSFLGRCPLSLRLG